MTDVHEGNGPRQVVVELSSVLAVYTGLFDAIFPRSAVADCFDVSDEFSDHLPSGGPWVLESWDSAGSVFVRNPEYWGEPAVAPRFVMRAIPDVDAEAAALAAGEVDFVYPQFFTGIEDLFAEPDTSIVRAAAPDFEGLYFQQAFGPLADPVFRKALALSIDREALFTEIYAPRGGDTILQCGPIVPGPFCGDAFADLTYDPAGAVAALTADGWILNAAGLWERDGVVPQVRWMINSGNVRREDAQAYLIPRLRAAGFDVVPDNCDATCVFQQRLPALDYDIAMYISTAPPDPAYLGSAFSCGASDNVQGWCDEAATRALIEADVTLDPAERAALVKSALEAMSNPDNLVMLPLYQFPRTAAYRTDRVGPPDVVEAELANYHAFANFWQWEDLDGDGEIVLGAEQWPICLNPVTECSNSSWMIWTTAYPLLPGVWRTTADGRFRTTDLVVGVPLVEVG